MALRDPNLDSGPQICVSDASHPAQRRVTNCGNGACVPDDTV